MTTDPELLCEKIVNALARNNQRLRRDREDLLQEARIIAWQHRDSPLLARMVKLRLIDRIRALYGRTSPHDGMAPSLRGTAIVGSLDAEPRLRDLVDRRAPMAPVDDKVAQRDDVDRALRALARLPDPEQAVLLASLRGETLATVAVRNGVTESAVCRRRETARRHLRQLVGTDRA